MATAKTTKKKSKPAKPLAAVVIPDAPDPADPLAVPDGAQTAYDTWLPIAQEAFAGLAVATYNQDPNLAFRNCVTGLAALTEHDDVLKTLPAPFDRSALDALPSIALATVYAAAVVDRASPGIITAQLQKARSLRDLMLHVAEGLVKSGDLPAAEVRRIQRGGGQIDTAQDCVDLAKLFTDNAADLAGKSAVTKKHIKDARTVGNQLLQALRPKGTPRQPLAETNAGVAAKDVLGAYLVQQYKEQMRRAALWIWGDEAEEHVPALHSRERPPKKKANGAAPAPGATKPTG
jgi:hypothetical protein